MSETTPGERRPESGKRMEAGAADIAPPAVEHERVPPEAEDFAHTLRRFAAERLEKRARNPGLYL